MSTTSPTNKERRMGSWIINATIEDPHGDPQALAEQLTDELTAGVCSYDDRTLEVSFAIDDDRDIITNELLEHARDHLPGGRIVELRIRTEQSLVDELARPVIPGLVGITEIGEILGVSRQRAHAITATANFPSAVAHLAAGPVYLESAVRAFAAVPRRAGRPKVVTNDELRKSILDEMSHEPLVGTKEEFTDFLVFSARHDEGDSETHPEMPVFKAWERYRSELETAADRDAG